MEKDIEIIDQTEAQEAAEFERLNARANENHEKTVAADNRAAEIIRQAEEYAKRESIKAEKAKARRKAYTFKSFVSVVAFLALSAAAAWAGQAEMVHRYIWIPAALVCLCAASLRLGAWFGRMAKK
mgnify:CR=1 FL=1